MTLNRDTILAIFLLLACGGLMMASFEIREPDYGQLSPATWPRVIIGVLSFLGLLYLIQSLRQGPDAPNPDAPKGLREFISHWRNVGWVFVLFLAYLVSIPYVGMLLGGMAFVFLLLNALGGLRNVVLHAVIALVAMGGVWALFTYALGVLLPTGDWTGF
ncbi:MAG: tripartite tricarboxylate transporter TctB family protein [Pseudomonadota bacterium]